MTSRPYSLRLDDDVRQALEAEAARDGRPPAQLAARAIQSMLETKAAKRAALEAAMAEADKGVFVSSGAMRDWVETWGTDAEAPVPDPDIKPA